MCLYVDCGALKSSSALNDGGGGAIEPPRQRHLLRPGLAQLARGAAARGRLPSAARASKDSPWQQHGLPRAAHGNSLAAAESKTRAASGAPPRGGCVTGDRLKPANLAKVCSHSLRPADGGWSAKGSTSEGRQQFELTCNQLASDDGACHHKALDVCGGDYETLGVDYTGPRAVSYHGQLFTAPGQRVLLIACHPRRVRRPRAALRS